VTAAALIEHGSAVSTPATCPATVSIGGGSITTFDGKPDSIANFADAFVHSCNTAFAILGSRLPNAALASAATELGLGVEVHIGRPAFGGTVATAASAFDRATIASDGGTTVASPLVLARVAAAVDAGYVADLRLTTSSLTAVRPAPLPGPVLAGLRSMMADAVTRGTASGVGLPAGTHAKTGTAVFVNAPAPRTDCAWLVGYRGDIAFAVLVVGGAKGGSVAGPVAARFLADVGS
jgi:cell division protein FtsI/penicillin-binding protein 2